MDRQVFTRTMRLLALHAALGASASSLASGPPIGGFVPFVGVALTNQFATIDDIDLGGTFFISQPSNSPGGAFLGPGSSTYYDIALLDTGAATHILTQDSYLGFDFEGEDFDGTQFQPIGGATGIIELQINDALGVYAAGLGFRTAEGNSLAMNNMKLRGQTSFAVLSAPTEWQLPNIIGLPMAAHHAIAILNNDPQIFPYKNRTVRTPQVELRDLGSGGGDITRRAELKIRPGIGFIQGPLYVFNLALDDILGGGELDLHDNPSSPSVVENGAMFVDVDMSNGTKSVDDKEFIFDTGANLTVISQTTAKRLGFDAVLDTPDFFLEVEGSGGVTGNVPGIFIDSLNIDTIGGSFTLSNVPVAVLDVTNPNDPGNIVAGILGTHLFNDRNLVIDANPSIGQGGVGPSLYISDPVTETHNWATNAASGTWAVNGNWGAAGTPDKLWVANVANVSGSNQTAVVAANSQVYQVTVSGTPTAKMTVQINSGATLKTFAETQINAGGRVELAAGSMLDTHFVELDGGTLAGSGTVFAGSGPFHGPVRNLSGRIEPGAPIGVLTIDGDLSQQVGGTLAIDLAGTTEITQYDRLAVGRSAFLAGTLEVKLSSFTPSVGAMFTILTTGQGIFGQFDNLDLPPGFQWQISYGAKNVVLSVGLDGDFNNDGKVDAADYVVWRSGPATPDDYNLWKANFGKPLGSSAVITTGLPGGTVPEPAGGVLLIISTLLVGSRARKR